MDRGGETMAPGLDDLTQLEEEVRLSLRHDDEKEEEPAVAEEMRHWPI